MTLKEMTTIHKRLFGLLPRGMENARPLDDIAKDLNVEIRTANELIADLNKKYGIPTGSKRSGEPTGVFLPISESEKSLGVMSLKTQGISMLERAKAIENSDISIILEYERQYPEVTSYNFLIPYKQMSFDFESKEVAN